jgi:hypothetical protein
MRLTEDRIQSIAKKIVDGLREQKMIKVKGIQSRVEVEIQRLVTQDLMIEDEIDAEVERQIDSMKRNIPYGSAEWNAVFTQLKDKICQQRNYVRS